MIAARQIFLGRVGAKLPYDAEVEYIESVIGSYIDTGFIQYSENVDISLRFALSSESFTSLAYDGLFGNAVRDGVGMVVLAKQQKNAYVFWRGGSTSNLGLQTIANANPFDTTVSFDNGTYVRTINGNSASGSYSGSIIGALRSMLIFGCALNSSTMLPAVGGYRAYSCQIRQNGVLVRDFQPVRFTNELGQSEGAMYDRVSGQLFRNQGTGAFTYGPDK